MDLNAAINVKAEAGAMTPPWIMTRWEPSKVVEDSMLSKKTSASQRRFFLQVSDLDIFWRYFLCRHDDMVTSSPLGGTRTHPWC